MEETFESHPTETQHLAARVIVLSDFVHHYHHHHIYDGYITCTVPAKLGTKYYEFKPNLNNK